MKKLSPEALRIIARGRTDDPTPADRERVRQRLARSLAAGAAIGATAGGTALAAGWVPKAIAAVVVLAGSAAVLGALHPWSARAPAPAAAPAAAALPAALPPAPLEPAAPTPAEAPLAPAPAHQVAPAVRAPHELPRPAPAPAAPAPPPEDGLVAETSALREAQLELRAGHAEQALQLLDGQLVRFRGGALEQERQAARILALCQLQQREAAQAATAALERDFPGSPLLSRVRSACAPPAR